MSDPRQEFIEAMRNLVREHGCGYITAPNLRRACIAFADAWSMDLCDKHKLETSGMCQRCRAALLREVGLEESGGKNE